MQLNSEDYKNAIRILFNKNPNPYSENTYVTCPYHTDKTPSLSISSYTGGYRCFSCQRKGHIALLCKDLTGKRIEEVLGKNPEDDFIGYSNTPQDIKPPKVLKTIEEIEEEVSIDIRGIITPWEQSEEACNYLRKRRIPSSIAEKYKMGFMKEGYINGYPFENRLVFPVYGKTGKVVAIEGRDVTFEAKRKCIYPERSSKPLFDFNSLDLTKPVYLFEGTLKKMISELDDEFKNSTNVFGVSISPYQFMFLDLIPHLILCPDRDRAGEGFVTSIIDRYKNTSKIIQVMRILNTSVKDNNDIVEKLNMSVRDFRLQGGFDISFE